MSKLESLLTFAVAITVVALTSGDCFAQGWAQTPPIIQASAFGYPATAEGCNDCSNRGCLGCRGHRSHPRIDAWKEHHAKIQARNAKITARNDAWPMPFDCADRQLYFKIWEPMIDQGFEEQCVLTSMHFDPETNELNKFGQHAVAGIMQNMPSTRKHVFVHREGDQKLNELRVQSVEDTIRTFYGQSMLTDGRARVSYSSALPNKIAGDQAEGITRLWYEKQPSPVIPISSGETINSAVGQN